jgi:adhesin transport system outer membrane protein
MRARSMALVGVLALLTTVAGTASAATLDEVVRTALTSYPAIAAAQADRGVAQFEIERARALHYPTVDMLGTRRLAGSARNLAQPRMRVNVWASGAIDSTIERETLKEDAIANREVETREDVAFSSAQAYLVLLRSLRALEVTRRNLERHQALVEDFAAIASIDVGRRFDLVQARSRLEQVRLQVAEREASIEAARAVLARYYPETVNPLSMELPAELAAPVAAAMKASIDRHPSVRAAMRDVEAAEANSRVARAERGPRVDIESTVGEENATSLVVTWPAFDLSRNAAEKAALAEVNAARARLEEQQRVIAERQSGALQDYLAARDRESVARGQIDLAEELVVVYREQFRIGRRNLLDLLNAFTELSNSELTLETAKVDKSLARYRIEYALGQLVALFDRPSR